MDGRRPPGADPEQQEEEGSTLAAAGRLPSSSSLLRPLVCGLKGDKKRRGLEGKEKETRESFFF